MSLTACALIDAVNVGLHPADAIGNQPTCTGSSCRTPNLRRCMSNETWRPKCVLEAIVQG